MMIEVGDTVPAFTAPVANGDIERFVLEERLESEAPIVLAFFPAAFSSTCSSEMAAFRDRLGAFEEIGATVYGVSVDPPYALNAFRDELDLGFDLLSDSNRDLIDVFGIPTDFEHIGVRNLAKRAVFVIDAEGTVTYAWVSDDPGAEPDYDEVQEAAAAAVA